MDDIKTLYRLNVKRPHLLTLMILSAFASMGAILMMPALPEMSMRFHIHTSTTQLAVTCFLLGYALGQLMYGPLANRYGRKKAIYVGIVIATLGSIFSIVSSPLESFHLLIVGRFLEAVGSSAGLSVSVAMINDFYFENDARRIMGLLMFAFAIVPGIAIFMGGILVQYIGWQSCFYFLLFYGLILIYPTHRLSETNLTPDRFALKTKRILQNYWKQIHCRKLIGFSIAMGFSGACVYVFGAEGPFIGIHILHIQPAVYGLFALTPYFGTLLGSILVTYLSKKNPMMLLKMAFYFECSATLMMLVLFLFHMISMITLLIPMGFFCIGHPIISATAISLAMQQTDDKSNGSAIVNFASMSVPVVMTFLLTAIHTQSAIVLPVIFFIGMVLMASCFWWTTH